ARMLGHDGCQETGVRDRHASVDRQFRWRHRLATRANRTIYTEVCDSRSVRPASHFGGSLIPGAVETRRGSNMAHTPSVRKYGLCDLTAGVRVHGVQFQQSLEAEQARFIHRSVPMAAVGGLFAVSLMVLVFRPVVTERLLYAWLGAFLILTAVR